MSGSSSMRDLDAEVRLALPEVLDAWLGLAATETEPVDPAAEEVEDGRLLGTVTLIGPRVTGTVGIRLPAAFAQGAVARLVGGNHTGPVSDADAHDLAGELCNMLAGRVAARLRLAGDSCELGVPEVGREPAGHGAPADGGRTDWSCQGHRLTVEIRLRYRKT